jgi:hypothetical protein
MVLTRGVNKATTLIETVLSFMLKGFIFSWLLKVQKWQSKKAFWMYLSWKMNPCDQVERKTRRTFYQTHRSYHNKTNFLHRKLQGLVWPSDERCNNLCGRPAVQILFWNIWCCLDTAISWWESFLLIISSISLRWTPSCLVFSHWVFWYWW